VALEDLAVSSGGESHESDDGSESEGQENKLSHLFFINTIK
jgi:hypothetical protein